MKLTRLDNGLGEYYGEPINSELPVFAVTMHDNRTSYYNYIGYYRDNENFAGYGEMQTEKGNYQAWGVVKKKEPYGLCRVLYNSTAEYIGLMNMTQHGKGKIKYSMQVNDEEYKGYFKDGMKHFYGEEKTNDLYYIGEFENDIKRTFWNVQAN